MFPHSVTLSHSAPRFAAGPKKADPVPPEEKKKYETDLQVLIDNYQKAESPEDLSTEQKLAETQKIDTEIKTLESQKKALAKIRDWFNPNLPQHQGNKAVEEEQTWLNDFINKSFNFIEALKKRKKACQVLAKPDYRLTLADLRGLVKDLDTQLEAVLQQPENTQRKTYGIVSKGLSTSSKKDNNYKISWTICKTTPDGPDGKAVYEIIKSTSSSKTMRMVFTEDGIQQSGTGTYETAHGGTVEIDSELNGDLHRIEDATLALKILRNRPELVAEYF